MPERRMDLRVSRQDFPVYASLPESNQEILRIIERVKRAKRAFTLCCTANELLALHRVLLDEAHAAPDQDRLDAVLHCLATVEFQLRLEGDPKTPDDFLESGDTSSAIDSYIEKYREEIVSTTKREIGLSRTLGLRLEDSQAQDQCQPAPSAQEDPPSESDPGAPRK